MTTTAAYGYQESGAARCTNAEPGTYGHECGRPAVWIGETASGFQACYCDDCRERGHEARDVVGWRNLKPEAFDE